MEESVIVSAPKIHINQEAEATGSITIEEMDMEGKSVTLKNNSDEVYMWARFPIKQNLTWDLGLPIWLSAPLVLLLLALC